MTEVSGVPRVGIVTVTFNSARDLPEFLQSVSCQRGVEVDLFVVDNASTDDSLEHLARGLEPPHRLHVISLKTNVGVAAGNNAGLEQALASGVDWILILNNDTAFGSSTIDSLVKAATATEAFIISPVIDGVDPPGSLWYGGGHLIPWRAFRVVHEGEGDPARGYVTAQPAEPTQYASTCCLLVAPEVFANVGMMDPSYFVYGDDVDFALRCGRAGYGYYVTSAARITHKAGASTGGTRSVFSAGWSTRNTVILSRRFLPLRMMLVSLAYQQLNMCLGHIRHRDSLAFFVHRQRWFWRGLTYDVTDHRLPAAAAGEPLHRVLGEPRA